MEKDKIDKTLCSCQHQEESQDKIEKEYKLPEENNRNNLEEPAIKYGADVEMTFSPPLTEEELADAITSDEFWDSTLRYIDELFNKK